MRQIAFSVDHRQFDELKALGITWKAAVEEAEGLVREGHAADFSYDLDAFQTYPDHEDVVRAACRHVGSGGPKVTPTPLYAVMGSKGAAVSKVDDVLLMAGLPVDPDLITCIMDGGNGPVRTDQPVYVTCRWLPERLLVVLYASAQPASGRA